VAHPLIGITTVRAVDGGRTVDRLSASYIEAVQTAGGIPVLLPNIADPSVLAHLDGLIISGGGDFDPATFGAENHGTHLDGVNPDRDATELRLLREAPPELPILGICRGIQALAVAFGGSLIQDIPTAVESPLRHQQGEGRAVTTHTVDVKPGSQLAAILGAVNLSVNSFHHQAVDSVPHGFRAVAWAPDGIIEGLEALDRPFCVGVQWHPEDLVAGEEHARRLFGALVAAAEEYQHHEREVQHG
jgi:putative glutamine amidotransferase